MEFLRTMSELTLPSIRAISFLRVSLAELGLEFGKILFLVLMCNMISVGAGKCLGLRILSVGGVIGNFSSIFNSSLF